jgi:hypothetical protein
MLLDRFSVAVVLPFLFFIYWGEPLSILPVPVR